MFESGASRHDASNRPLNLMYPPVILILFCFQHAHAHLAKGCPKPLFGVPFRASAATSTFAIFIAPSIARF